MAETLDRIRYRLSMDALAGFLNGPRAFSSQAGKTTGTVVSRHQSGYAPLLVGGAAATPDLQLGSVRGDGGGVIEALA